MLIKFAFISVDLCAGFFLVSLKICVQTAEYQVGTLKLKMGYHWTKAKQEVKIKVPLIELNLTIELNFVEFTGIIVYSV